MSGLALVLSVGCLHVAAACVGVAFGTWLDRKMYDDDDDAVHEARSVVHYANE